MTDEKKRISAIIPMHLWSVFEAYRARTSKSFTSFITDSLLDLEQQEREREQADIERRKERRLFNANAHLYPRA